MLSLKTAMIQKQKCIVLNIVKILRKLIKEVKKQHYFKLIAKYNNKVRTTWNIIKKRQKSSFSVTGFQLTCEL